MKKIKIVLVGIFCCGMLSMNAQHDVRLNVIGLLFNDYGLGYEKVLNEEMSVGGSISYSVWKFGGAFFDTDIKYTGLKIAPEFRFYFNPDDDCSGFYVGPYVKYRALSASGLEFGGATSVIEYKESNTGVAGGLVLGRKWMTDGGVYFESLFGFGKYFINNTSYDDQEVEDFYEDLEDEFITDFPKIDLRFAVSIGYRIQ